MARRILLVHLRTIGDAVLSSPTLRALHRTFPEAQIDYLVAPASAGALAGNPHLHEVLVYHSGAKHLPGLLLKLRRRRYDLVVDFHSTSRTAVLVAATGAAVRIGKRGRGPRNRAYTHLVPKERSPVYIAQQMLDTLAPAGVSQEVRRDVTLEIGVGAEEREWAAGVWERLGLPADVPVVAMSPVSRESHKQWGAARWAQVADAVMESGARILLTHGPGERDQAAAVVERMRTVPAWDYGPTTLPQLAALYEGCALWVGNDGGAKHIAVAAGIPTVSVNNWQTGAPWTDTRPESAHAYLEREPPQGCDRGCSRCVHLGCLESIPVDEVLTTVHRALPRAGVALVR